MRFISQIFRLLSFLRQRTRTVSFSRVKILLIIVAGVISGLSNAALIATINEILGGEKQSVIWIFVGLCVVLPLTRFTSGVLVFHLATRANYEMRLQLSRKIASASLGNLEILGSHRLLGTLTNDVPAVSSALVALPTFLMQFFIVVGSLVFLAWLSWVAFLAVVVFMVLGVVGYQLPARKAMRYVALAREGWDEVLKHFRALIDGIKELKLHSVRRDDFFEEELGPAARRLRRSSFLSRTIFIGALTWGQVLFFILVGLLLFVFPSFQDVGSDVLRGYVLALLYMMNPLNGILDVVPVFGTASVAIRKIESLGLSLDSEPEMRRLPADLGLSSEWQNLQLCNVTHRYHLEDEDFGFSLGPLDLAIRRGDLLFITGGNGSGKTTLIKIITGLYAPGQGEIRLDGKVVKGEKIEAYRQQFAAVFGDFYLFDKLLGLRGQELDGQAGKYLEGLQLDHKLYVENGKLSTTDLSQGQRKRLALLTAYLEDRPVYLFDEWAADQDPEFKDIFYFNILPDLKKRGKTVIVISHDDRYFHIADHLVKLESGQIVSGASVDK